MQLVLRQLPGAGCTRSSQPFAELLFVQNVSMFKSYIAQPNGVARLPVLPSLETRSTLALWL